MLQMMKNYIGLIKWLKWNMKLFTFVKMSLIINCSALSNVLKMINELNDSLNEK